MTLTSTPRFCMFLVERTEENEASLAFQVKAMT
jgi:hypothetical protein